MESIREQIIMRIKVALTGATTATDRVFRSREMAVTREESPCILIMPDVEESSVFSGGNVDENIFTVSLEIFARGDPWDSIADQVATAAHRALLHDVPLLALVTNVRKTTTNWSAEEADLTAGCCTTKYQLKYLSPSDDMTQSL